MTEDELRIHVQKRFGYHLSKARKNKGFSQETLAERSGFHRTYIGAVERGEKNLTMWTVAKFSAALDIDGYQLYIGALEIIKLLKERRLRFS